MMKLSKPIDFLLENAGLETLAYTNKWRTPENITHMADVLNHYNDITQGSNPIHVKIGNRYYAPFPLNMANSPIRPSVRI